MSQNTLLAPPAPLEPPRPPQDGGGYRPGDVYVFDDHMAAEQDLVRLTPDDLQRHIGGPALQETYTPAQATADEVAQLEEMFAMPTHRRGSHRQPRGAWDEVPVNRATLRARFPRIMPLLDPYRGKHRAPKGKH